MIGHVWLAATLVRLGRRGEAKALATEVLRRFPRLNLTRWPTSLYRRGEDSDHITDALHLAGFAC